MEWILELKEHWTYDLLNNSIFIMELEDLVLTENNRKSNK